MQVESRKLRIGILPELEETSDASRVSSRHRRSRHRIQSSIPTPTLSQLKTLSPFLAGTLMIRSPALANGAAQKVTRLFARVTCTPCALRRSSPTPTLMSNGGRVPGERPREQC